MTPLGINLTNGGILYIKDSIIYEASVSKDIIKDEKVSETMFDFIRSTVFGAASANLPKIGKSFIYTRMSIFGTSYPIFPVVGLVNGMTDILKRYKVEHTISDKRIENNGDFVEVKFQDKFLYYKDTVKNTLLLNVLYMMNTEDYDLSDFDLDKPYMDFFVDKLGQPMFIKNTLKTNFSVLLDPITIDVLKDLKLPTNIVDLLLLANTMLISNSIDHRMT